jgi:hypothetical protein
VDEKFDAAVAIHFQGIGAVALAGDHRVAGIRARLDLSDDRHRIAGGQLRCVGDGRDAAGQAVRRVEFAGDLRRQARTGAVHHPRRPRFGFAQALVFPVPDEAALEQSLAAEILPVSRQAARRVAHGVVVFALDHRALAIERFLLLLAAPLFQPADFKIHRGEQIDVGGHPGALVMHRPGRVALFDPLRAGDEIRPVAGFVAHRPDDRRRVVLEGLDHVDDAVEVGRFPGRDLGQRFLVVTHAVGLDVRLADHVEAVFVAQLEEARVVRVVAGADGVDVEPLHLVEVVAHVLLGDVMAAVGVVVVAVDALE